MPLDLPNGVTITQLRATGLNVTLAPSPTSVSTPGPGVIVINLLRQSLTRTDLIANISPAPSSATSYDQTQAALANVAVVDRTQFIYYITAELSGANPTDTVSIASLQITYQTP